MNKRIFNALLLSAGLLTIQNSFAQDHERQEPKFKKNKSYSKSYSLGGSDKIHLSNQFGDMKLVTWDKNEIKVDVSITGKADEEARAQEILDKISIADSKNGNTVSFVTKFADDKWNDSDNDNKNKNSNRNENRDSRDRNTNRNEHHNEGMDIDYVVYLPSQATLKAENQFGNLIVPDYRGEADLSSKFGSLTAGKLGNTKEVTVEFGEANIASISGGDLNIKFSNGTVNNLSGNVDCDLQFSQVKLVVDKDTKGLQMNTSYSTTYLDVDKGLSANYAINTSHGSFDNKSSFAIKEKDDDKDGYGPRFNHSYTGVSGSGGSKVTVNSSFGEIVIGHNLQVDMTKKRKNKSTRAI